MRFIRISALVGVALAAAISIPSAGAGPSRTWTPTRVDLSTRTAINAYLRSIGVDPATVVVQHGRRNHAGARCPGRGWNCTTARRVVQISTHGMWNQFECSPSNVEPPSDPPPRTQEPDTCLVVQSSTDADNVAVCREQSDSPNVTQTCTIIQQSSSGVNRARVRQVAEQNEEETASATQRADVTQHNQSGKNTLKIIQKVSQSADGSGYTVAQDLGSDQKFTITQDATTGRQVASMSQSTDQDGQAEDVSGGTQHESASLIGDVVHQTSAGKGTIRVTQREHQNEEAPQDSGVEQTIVGPEDCCTDQGTNPADDFRIKQKSVQDTTSASAQLSEDMNVFCSSSGTCDGAQDAVENGDRTANSCSSTGSFCRATLECTNGDCTTFSCSGESCEIEGPPPPPSMLLGDSAVGPSADYTPAGEAEAFLTTAVGSGTPGTLRVYLDSGSTATALVVGLYSDMWGRPDMLLAQGTLSSPAPGAWNDVILATPPSVTAGTPYWIALLGPSGVGVLRFRDHCCGGGSPAEASAEKDLSEVPETWTTGTTFRDGSVSAYG